MSAIWIGLLTTTVFLQTALCVCPDTWVKHGASCYAFSSTAVSFVDAIKECDVFGESHLAEIESKGENDYIKAQLRKRNTGSVWLGGSDLLAEGSWVWDISGQPFNFTDWKIGEPTQPHDHDNLEQDCLTMWKNHNYQWGDLPCDHKIGFVCERPYQ